MRNLLLISASLAAISFAQAAMADDGSVNLTQNGVGGTATVDQSSYMFGGSNNSTIYQDANSSSAQITVFQNGGAGNSVNSNQYGSSSTASIQQGANFGAAGNDSVTSTQVDHSSLTVYQGYGTTLTNSSIVNDQHDYSTARIEQENGDRNYVENHQSGAGQGYGNSLTAYQNGNNNYIYSNQSGYSLTASISQTGDHNTSIGNQFGNSNTATITQTSNYNQVNYTQAGNSNSATIRQH